MFINLEHVHDCEQADNIKHWLNIVGHVKETSLEQGRESGKTPRQPELLTESRGKWRWPTFKSGCLYTV